METKEIVGHREDRATYRFRVGNRSGKPAKINRAEFIVDEVDIPERHNWSIGSTMMVVSLIDHTGHILVQVGSPNAGDTITVPVDVTIPADAHRDITIWFQGPDDLMLFFVTGRLRLYSGDDTITSKSVELEIHPETNKFPTRKEFMSSDGPIAPAPEP
jgi:DNA polymerase III sliding clamp (beta) subunit (PCNA family)